jgi:hypothetical protein
LCTVDKGIGSNFEFGFQQWRGTVHLACFMGKTPAEASNAGFGSRILQQQSRATSQVTLREITMKLCALMEAMESGANSPSPGKRWFIRPSFERVKKLSSTKPQIVLGRIVLGKKSASPGTFDEKKPKVAAKRRGPRPS